MIVENGSDPSLGAPAGGTPDNSDSGNQGATPSASGASGDQGGAQPADWAAKEKQYQQQIRSLNQAVIDSRRSGNRNQPGNTPEGNDPNMDQYAMALEVAENRLRSGLEPILKLYPEIPASEIARVRSNPWAFAGRESMLSGDFSTALLEIEQALLDRATELGGQPANGQTPANGQPAPANLNNNPAPAAPETDPAQGQDLWSMPMEELEKLKNKEVAKATRQS